MTRRKLTASGAARERAADQCEAMVRSGRIWVRCIAPGTDVHHMLPRSRGGHILDRHGESYHLVVLCRAHHRHAHEMRKDADAGGLMIDGQVSTGLTGKPVYRGTDTYLLRKYGDVAQTTAGHGPADHPAP